MRKVLLLVVSLMVSAAAWGQSSQLVQWTFKSKKLQPKVYEVHMTAQVGGNFHIYAQNAGVKGPVATFFKFARNPQLAPQGNVKEVGKLKSVNERAFRGVTHYYEDQVDFVQVVVLKSVGKKMLNGKVEFMVCNDHECLPPSDVAFSVALGE